MKIKLLGTGAAEGIPAFCCNCDVCSNANEIGGKEIRRRSGTIVDDDLLIEFSPDIYMHKLNNKLDLGKIRNIAISHSHSDHLNASDLMMLVPPVFAKRESYPINMYGNEHVYELYKENGLLSYKDLMPYNMLQAMQPYKLPNSDKTIIPLPAEHKKDENCYVFLISNGEKTFFYGHDSGYYPESTWEALKNYKIDLAVLDCVFALRDNSTGHMGFSTNVEVKERMLAEGIANKNTKFIATHFSHNTHSTQAEMEKRFAPHGFLPAYDGMEIII